MPRGTDIIPAMLTPGEYVVNRRATSAIGASVLQKLNHMDLSGAMRELSLRVGQGISNSVSNSRIANVTVNNYNAPSVGIGRANGWVKRLT